MMYQYFLSLGDVAFRLTSPLPVAVETAMEPFLRPDCGQWDIQIEISQRDLRDVTLPDRAVGHDFLLDYYKTENGLLCVANGGAGPVALTPYSSGCDHIECYVNPKHWPALSTLGNLLRLIPINVFLRQKNVLLLHAAQVVYRDRGILFSAPSGTGKTTQARLWRDVLGARIICNDRTLIRQGRTFGYPVDGSDPICSGEVHPLGAVVLLSQGRENQIHRLGPAQAVARLMPQLVMDTWSEEARETAIQQLLELAAEKPVYHLSCTPEPSAVRLLEQTLLEEGVLE